MSKWIPKDNEVADLQTEVLAWYSRNARDLPWRHTREPYAILVSEIMLQQTRVDTVIPFYNRFLTAFPDLQALAEADEQKLLKLWEGLGYYRRARNLQKAAIEIVRKYNGNFPKDADSIRTLPGIGAYTSGAIASIAFGITIPAVDGNVLRVYARLFRIMESIDTTRTKQSIEGLAARLVSPEQPGDYNQAIMEIGALLCQKNSTKCQQCPVQKYCRAFAENLQNDLPVRTPKSKPPLKTGLAFYIENDQGEILLVKRPDDIMLGGMWELPTIVLTAKTDKNETCQRVAAFLKMSPETSCLPVVQIKHAYSHFSLSLNGFRLLRNQIRMPENGAIFELFHCDKVAWCNPDNLAEYPVHQAQRKLLEAFRSQAITPDLFDQS